MIERFTKAFDEFTEQVWPPVFALVCLLYLIRLGMYFAPDFVVPDGDIAGGIP